MFNSKGYHSEADSDAVSVNSSASESGSLYSLGPALASFDWNDDTAVEYHVNEHDAEEPGGVLPVFPSAAQVAAGASDSASGPSDLSRGPGDGPVICPKPRGGYPKSFPTKSAPRCFKEAWKTSWLEYSSLTDMVYCHRCRHFGKGALPVWEGQGSRFNMWNKATTSIEAHKTNPAHRQAEVRYADWKQSLITGEIRDVVVKDAKKLAADNTLYVATVAEVVNFCGRQAIALRGHGEHVGSDNKGNFLELLDVISRHDAVVNDKLRSGRRYYTSPCIQNELLEIQANLIHGDICAEIRRQDSTPSCLMSRGT